MFRHFCGTVLLCLLVSLSYSNTVTTLDFIDQKSRIAVEEMYRTGIPASITIAQSIIESSWGNGELAINSNNYFGIKCKKDWQGNTYYIEDDDYENGKLIKSCFRAYGSIEESFRDHSDFLINNPRYAALFELEMTDYKGWAWGLQKAGYATDKRYAKKLIAKIEEYRLYEYDYLPTANLNVETGMPAVASTDHTEAVPTTETAYLQPAVDVTADYTEVAAVEMAVPEAFVLPDDYVPHYFAIQRTEKSGEPMPAVSTEARRAKAPVKPRR